MMFAIGGCCSRVVDVGRDTQGQPVSDYSELLVLAHGDELVIKQLSYQLVPALHIHCDDRAGR